MPRCEIHRRIIPVPPPLVGGPLDSRQEHYRGRPAWNSVPVGRVEHAIFENRRVPHALPRWLSRRWGRGTMSRVAPVDRRRSTFPNEPAVMPVKVQCPNPDCCASYSIADELLGRTGRCKKCGTKFVLDAETPAPDSA